MDDGQMRGMNGKGLGSLAKGSARALGAGPALASTGFKGGQSRAQGRLCLLSGEVGGLNLPLGPAYWGFRDRGQYCKAWLKLLLQEPAQTPGLQLSFRPQQP